MRTTIRLDDHLLADAKRVAAETGRTLAEVIEEALREALARPAHPAHQAPFHFPPRGPSCQDPQD